MYPIWMLNFEKLGALMSQYVILYESQTVQVLFGTSHDDFHSLEAELKQIFWVTWFFRLITYICNFRSLKFCALYKLIFDTIASTWKFK